MSGYMVPLLRWQHKHLGSRLRFHLMKILVVNLHSSANAGDDVLTQETVRQLYAAFAGASVTLAMNDPDSYQGPAATVVLSWPGSSESDAGAGGPFPDSCF